MKTNPAKPTTLIQITPRPTRCRTRIVDPDDAPKLRRLDCASYDRCLSFAADRDWRGFHCNDCPAYQRQSEAACRRDHLAILLMLEETQLIPSLLSPEPDDITDEEESDHTAAGRLVGAPRHRGFAPDPDDTDSFAIA